MHVIPVTVCRVEAVTMVQVRDALLFSVPFRTVCLVSLSQRHHKMHLAGLE